MCNMCDYQATLHNSLETHKKTIHEDVKYMCTRCDYQEMDKGNLKRHESIHEGLIGVIGVTIQLHNRTILRITKKV